jgi:GT2 family glycosyltransferase
VTAIIVACNGQSWLPRSLAAVTGQTRAPERIIGVDAGSADPSERLLREAGLDAVVSVPGGPGFGAAVRAALEVAPALPPQAEPPAQAEWLWLLHDDSAPEPDALAALLDGARRSPRACVLGAKARGWNDPSLLLECGLSMTDSGRRITGIQLGDRDQGQRDDEREVLAVGTAGMLVRRDVFERLGGFDPALPTFGADLEFCVRARRAGEEVVVVPQAVLHHRQAGRHGIRTVPGRQVSPDLAERAAGFHTVLVHTSPLKLPFTSIRLLLRSIVAGLLLLLGGAPRDAAAEVGVWSGVHLRPATVARARRQAARTAVVPRRELRAMRPLWSEQMGAALERASVRNGPPRTKRPGGQLFWAAVLGVVLAALAAAATRSVWTGSGPLAGGALLPVPSGSELWAAFRSVWHDVGLGSVEPGAPWVLPILGVAVAPFIGAPTVVSLLLLGTVPLAGLSAFLALRGVLGAPGRAVLATAYALTPAAVVPALDGRLGTAVAAVVLPPMLRLAVRLAAGDRIAVLAPPRLRTAAGAALLLGVLVAFAPVLWIAAAVLLIVAGLAVRNPGPASNGARWGRIALVLLAPAALLWPWSWSLLTEPSRFAFEAGAPWPGAAQPAWRLLLLDPGGLGPQAWVFGAPLVLIGLAALLVPAPRRFATWCWAVVAVGLALAVVQSVRGYVPVGGTSAVPAFPGPALLLCAAAMTAAAAAAGRALRATTPPRRTLAASAVAVALLLAGPLGLAAAWLTTFAGPLQRTDTTAVPAFAAEEATGPERIRTLLLSRQPDGAVDYTLVNGRGLRMGDADVAPAPASMQDVTEAVAALAGGIGPRPAEILGAQAVRYIVAPAGDLALVAALDGNEALRRLSTTGDRALWRIDSAVPRATVVPDADEPPASGAQGVPMRSGPILTALQPLLDGPVPVSGPNPALVLAQSPAAPWRVLADGEPVNLDSSTDRLVAALPGDAGQAQLLVEADQDRRDLALLVPLAVLVALVLLTLPTGRRTPPPDPDTEPAPPSASSLQEPGTPGPHDAAAAPATGGMHR